MNNFNINSNNISGGVFSSGTINNNGPSGSAGSHEPPSQQLTSSASDPLPGRGRLLLSFDITGYSALEHDEQVDTQIRLRRIVESACPESIGYQNIQTTGDGLNVVLNSEINEKILSSLLISLKNSLLLEKRRYVAPLMIRMSIAFGAAEHSDLGFSGKSIIDLVDILNSRELREISGNKSASVMGTTSVVYELFVRNQPHLFSEFALMPCNFTSKRGELGGYRGVLLNDS